MTDSSLMAAPLLDPQYLHKRNKAHQLQRAYRDCAIGWFSIAAILQFLISVSIHSNDMNMNRQPKTSQSITVKLWIYRCGRMSSPPQPLEER